MTRSPFARILVPVTLALAACTGKDTSPAGIDLLPGDVLGGLQTLVSTSFARAVDFAVFPADRGRADRLTTAHDWPSASDFESRVLARFSVADLDSLPTGTTFEDPTLRLVFRRPKERVEFRVHRVTSSWSEEAATWTRREFGQAWATPGGDFDPTPIATFAVVPVPEDTTTTPVSDSVSIPIPDSIFAGWRSGVIANHGLIVVQETPGEVIDFVSRGFAGENANGPTLQVLALLPEAAVPADVKLLAAEDLYIALDESPFPADGIVVRGAEPPRRAVLEPRFEDVPTGATIASSQLVLTIRAVDVPRDSLTVFAVPLVTEFRGENTVFASIAVNLGFVTLLPTAQPGDTVVFESRALTFLTRRWVADPESEPRIGLRLPEGGPTGESVFFGGVQFHGVDAAPGLGPRLRIVFTPSVLPGEEE